jgi:hypothetical protein
MTMKNICHIYKPLKGGLSGLNDAKKYGDN